MPPTCRACGAPLEMAFGRPVTRCDRCGADDLAGPKAPPMPGPTPGFTPRAGSGSGLSIVVPAIALVVLAIGAMAALTFTRRVAVKVASAPYTPPAPVPAPAPAAASDPIVASDPTRVDPAELIRQAVARAKKVDPDAKLVGAHFAGVSHGTLDMTGASQAFIAFQYWHEDKSKRPGEDVVEGQFDVRAEKGAWSIWAHETGAGMAHDVAPSSRWAAAFPLDAPRCSGADAWDVAVATGVPDDALATAVFGKVDPFKPDKATQWSFRVEGHDEHRREIDTTTCKLLRSWAPAAKTPSAQPPAPPPAPRPHHHGSSPLEAEY